jgi:formylglycine-generating enzyme required for sulfatase activity
VCSLNFVRSDTGSDLASTIVAVRTGRLKPHNAHPPVLAVLGSVLWFGCSAPVAPIKSHHERPLQPLKRTETDRTTVVDSGTESSAATSSGNISTESLLATDAAHLAQAGLGHDGMLLVPGGTFTMGADSGGEEDEHPSHRATVESYWLDANEVTVHDYMQCVSAGACRMSREQFDGPTLHIDAQRFRQPMQPVSGISWDDAQTYCRFRGKRLPREVEWERAARGDDARTYPWGNELPDAAVHGCFGRALGPLGGTTCTVGSFPQGAGPYGHLDLAGNVWEWLLDYYDPIAYRRSGAGRGEHGSCQEILETQNWLRATKRQGYTGTNPIPTSCERVLRGGAFNYPAQGLRATNRVHHPGNWRLLMAGVRCARDIQTGLTSNP